MKVRRGKISLGYPTSCFVLGFFLPFFWGSHSFRMRIIAWKQSVCHIKGSHSLTECSEHLTFLVWFICTTAQVKMSNLFPLIWRERYFSLWRDRSVGCVSSVRFSQQTKYAATFIDVWIKHEDEKVWNFFFKCEVNLKNVAMFQSKIKSSRVWWLIAHNSQT